MKIVKKIIPETYDPDRYYKIGERFEYNGRIAEAASYIMNSPEFCCDECIFKNEDCDNRKCDTVYFKVIQ